MERYSYWEAIDRVGPAWRTAAERLGGTYERRVDADGQKQHTIAAELDGVAVHVSDHVDLTGPLAATWTLATRARVPVDEPGFGLRLLPWDERYVPAVTLGDPAFDRRVFIESNLPRYARTWLEDVDRDLPVSEVDFQVGRNIVSATIQRVLGNAAAIERLARSAVRFAGGGRVLRRRWLVAAEAMGAHPRGRLRLDAVVSGMLVHVFVDDAHAHTIVQIERGRGQRLEERLPGIEPDLAGWREAIERLLGTAGAARGVPYR